MNTENDFRRLMGRLRLRHLALLDLLGKDPNVGRAAKIMHMAQPTASKLLREIEDIFETALFIRSGHFAGRDTRHPNRTALGVEWRNRPFASGGISGSGNGVLAAALRSDAKKLAWVNDRN